MKNLILRIITLVSICFTTNLSAFTCESDFWFEKPTSNKQFETGSDVYVKVKARRYQDIEYMKLYLNGQYIRKESSSPYEWCKSGSSGDNFLRNMQAGHYTLKVKVKDRCGRYFEKESRFEIRNGYGGGNDHCEWDSWFEYPNNGGKYDSGSNVYVRVKAKKYQDIEYMKLYVNGQFIRKESQTPYEWCKSNSSGDNFLKNMQPGHYSLKVVIKDKCGFTNEKECGFEIKNGDSGGNHHCENEAWFDAPNRGGKYTAGSNVLVKVNPRKAEDIDYMKLYVNGSFVRKVTNGVFQWGYYITHGGDSELLNMQPGSYALKVLIKDKCGKTTYKYSNFEVEDGFNNHCDWNAWFQYPNSDEVHSSQDLYVKVKADKYQDIEYMKLYINGQYVRKESHSPYEWCKSGSSGDRQLRNLNSGEYRLTVKIKDKCGDYHEVEKRINVTHF